MYMAVSVMKHCHDFRLFTAEYELTLYFDVFFLINGLKKWPNVITC